MDGEGGDEGQEKGKAEKGCTEEKKAKMRRLRAMKRTEEEQRKARVRLVCVRRGWKGEKGVLEIRRSDGVNLSEGKPRVKG